MTTLVPVIFRFPGTLAHRAGQVAVVGPFNGWNPAVHLLTKRADGDWTITIYLPPGPVIYQFSVDGAFWLDPHDEGRVPNGWGSEYSIRFIRRDTTPHRTRSAALTGGVTSSAVGGEIHDQTHGHDTR